MKKQFLFGVALALTSLLPNGLFAQSTQGTDFWVTLMRGDGGSFQQLSLTFAAKKATNVYIENVRTGFKDTVEVGNDTVKRYVLDDISHLCYVTENDEEQAVDRALRVQSDEPISLIAANYKDKSFDVAAILPDAALMSEYRVQCYTPSAHVEGSSSKHRKPQGSHFAIVAAEDNVVVDITPSVATHGGKAAGVTFATDTLKRGQVYYVWSGADDCPGSDGSCQGEGEDYDFTGTIVKARNNKKIAVFNGNSHTNIPYRTRDRDHIYSQAMPINYWGKRFAITSSLTTIDYEYKVKLDGQSETKETKRLDGYWERIDKVRVLALQDSTKVYIDGFLKYTFDFASNPKRFYEFDFGAEDNMTRYTQPSGIDYFTGSNHYIETSCPCAVHLFMTSNQYDHDEIKEERKEGKDKYTTTYQYCNGDPSLIWVNPIEQKIDTLTFGTFQTAQVKDHFINIVTQKENVKSVILDGDSIYDQFSELAGNPDYVFARITGVEDRAHTLTADSGFIAHVYGFGEKESYGYPAGGLTKDLTPFITINGVIYRADADNKPICGDDIVKFGTELNYEYDSVYWVFGDGQDTIAYPGMDTMPHFYELPGTYKGAYAVIYRHMGDDEGCINFSASDTIRFIVNVGTYKVDIKGQRMPECTQAGDQVDFLIYLDNPGEVSLTSDSVKFHFTQTAIDDHFTDDLITVDGDTMLIVHLPKEAKDGVEYGLHLHIGSECPNSTLDKDLTFSLKFAKTVLEQRYKNVLGLAKDSFPNRTLSNFVWFHNGDTIKDQITSVLHLDQVDMDGEYRVCYTIHEAGKPDYEDCTCPVRFEANSKTYTFGDDETNLIITATYSPRGNKVFVNAKWGEKTKFEDCYAEWLDVSGRVWQEKKFNIPDGGCTIDTPTEGGFYILRVKTDGASRSFKMFIND